MVVTRHVYPIGLTIVLAFVQSCPAAAQTGPSDKLELTVPFATPSVRNASKVIGWPQGRMPTPAPGFEVSLFAENLERPRSTYILPNGDVLVVEATRVFPGRSDKSANRITLFRDTRKDGKPDVREVFLEGLNMPHGMLLVGNWFYVGNTDGVVRYPYRTGQTRIDEKRSSPSSPPRDPRSGAGVRQAGRAPRGSPPSWRQSASRPACPWPC